MARVHGWREETMAVLAVVCCLALLVITIIAVRSDSLDRSVCRGIVTNKWIEPAHDEYHCSGTYLTTSCHTEHHPTQYLVNIQGGATDGSQRLRQVPVDGQYYDAFIVGTEANFCR